MALDLFRVSLGLDIESDDFSSNAYILQGTGEPGSDAAEQDAAPIGSLYLRTDAETEELQLYYKYRTTQNSVQDWHQPTSKTYVDALVNGLSWRDPVLVHDTTTYANIAAAEAAANVGDTVDGVTINVGDRILLSDLTTGNDNVYIVSGSTGAWTFTEDTNLATDGDALLVEDGNLAEEQWVYDGTTWVKIAGANNNAELGHIRTFIGKNAAGAESPVYSSTDIVTQNVSLEAAIGELDAIVGTMTFTEQNEVTNGVDVTGNLDALDIKIGDSTFTSSFIVAGANDITENFDALDLAIGNRTYTNDFFVTDAQTITASIDALDTQFGANTFTSQFHVTNGQNVTQHVDALDLQLGSALFTNDNILTDGQTVTASLDALDTHQGSNTFTEQNFVTDGENITQHIDAIDVELGNIQDQSLLVKATNITTQVVVDTVLADVAKWIVTAEEAGTPGNRYSTEIHAVTDGTSVDSNKASTVKIGSNITGLTITVDTSGGNLRVLISSTAAVDVSVKRLAAHTIN